jgi:hypothetical protein
MRLSGYALGQTTTPAPSTASQNFGDPTDLLNWCAANPSLQAGYAPSGQSSPQTLSCSEWPSVLQNSGLSNTTVVVDETTTTSDLGTWLTEATIDPTGTIPNWAVLAGVAVIGWYFLEKKR